MLLVHQLDCEGHGAPSPAAADHSHACTGASRTPAAGAAGGIGSAGIDRIRLGPVIISRV